MLENMIEPVISPSTTRVLLRPRLARRPAGLLVFAALFFTVPLFVAADAQASAASTPAGATDTPIGEAATSGDTPTEQPAPSTGEQSPPAAEATLPTTEQAPPVVSRSTNGESVPPVEQSPPVVEPPPTTETTATTEQTATATESPPPVAEATPPPVAEVTPPPVAEATPPPVVEATPPPIEKAPPAAEAPVLPPPVEQPRPVAEEPGSVVDKKTAEQTAGDVSAEAGSNAMQGPGEGSQAPADVSGSTHKDAVGEVAPGAPGTVTAPAAPAVLSEISMPLAQDQPSFVFPAPSTSAHAAGQTDCELVALGASIAAGEARGLLGSSVYASASIVPLATVEASSAATAPGGSGDGDGGSAVDHPSSPTPGPGSGGAGSGSAAGGGSGSASTAPFTLVGALLQAAPRAMRRLLLAQQSWRTSFLVLIPERPD
jgi:hypothetical protein